MYACMSSITDDPGSAVEIGNSSAAMWVKMASSWAAIVRASVTMCMQHSSHTTLAVHATLLSHHPRCAGHLHLVSHCPSLPARPRLLLSPSSLPSFLPFASKHRHFSQYGHTRLALAQNRPWRTLAPAHTRALPHCPAQHTRSVTHAATQPHIHSRRNWSSMRMKN